MLFNEISCFQKYKEIKISLKLPLKNYTYFTRHSNICIVKMEEFLHEIQALKGIQIRIIEIRIQFVLFFSFAVKTNETNQDLDCMTFAWREVYNKMNLIKFTSVKGAR